MAKVRIQAITVRIERLPSRNAIERVREAYRQLGNTAAGVERENSFQEEQDEPIGSSICKSDDR
jgi:hypothetical protein